MNSTRSIKLHYKKLNELSKEESQVDLESFEKLDDVVHIDTQGSKVVEFLEGKSVFITGGTGFIGKLLIEKLLRSCKNLGKIYFLIRVKKNKDTATRTKELLQCEVFGEVKKVQPDFAEKVIPINGDILLPNLGLREDDIEILKKEVNIIFHVAASINLNEKLRTSFSTNVVGTRNMVALAKSCTNLVSFVHVSTAFCNCIQDKVDEKIYKPTMTDDQLLQTIESLGEKLEQEEIRIIGKWPNSYVLTKNIAEYVVKSKGKDLPACIIRPAIVMNTYKEPLKAYVDNYAGTVGIVSNIFAGVLRTAHVGEETIVENVPADYVVNAIIVAAYRNHVLRGGDVKVYNYVSSTENPLKINDLLDMTLHFGYQTPTMKSLWYPVLTINANYYTHLLYTIIFHYTPAYLFDVFQQLSSKKPWMLSFYKKVFAFNESIACFGMNEWNFTNYNVQEMWKELNDVDKKVFPFSMSKDSFNWVDYCRHMNLGTRLYLFNDKMETLAKAKRKLQMQYFLHLGLKYVSISLLTFLISVLIRRLRKNK